MDIWMYGCQRQEFSKYGGCSQSVRSATAFVRSATQSVRSATTSVRSATTSVRSATHPVRSATNNLQNHLLPRAFYIKQ